MRGSVDGGLISAGAVGQAASDATDGRYTDACEVMYFAIRQIFLQILDDLPTVDHRLEFRGGAQIIEEIAHFSSIFQSQQRNEEIFFGAVLLAI